MFHKLLKVLFKVAFRVEVQGELVETNEGNLIVSNHTSFLDGLFLGLFLPKQLKPVFIIHSEIAKRPFFRFFLRGVEHLLVDPSHPMAIKKVIGLLKEGRNVVIFPEGRITITGSLMKIYSGAAFAAMKAGVIVTPVHITGAQYTYFSRLKGQVPRRLFPKLKLHIYKPTKIVANEELMVRERREDAKVQLRDIMTTSQLLSREKVGLWQQLYDSAKVYGKNQLILEDPMSNEEDYQSLLKKVVALSTLLPTKMSKRVGLMLPNSNGAVVAFFALSYMGKTPAMINYSAGVAAIQSALQTAKAKQLLTSRKFIEKANLATIVTELDIEIIYLEDLRQQLNLLNKIKIGVKCVLPTLFYTRPNPDDEAVLLFTSGSEGAPKGVLHSHHSLLTNVEQIKSVSSFTPSDKFMSCLPMFHAFGLTAGLIFPLSTGSKIFLYPNPLHYRVISEVIYDRGCTTLLATSTFLAGYARFADQYDFYSLKYVIAGAEKLSPEVSYTYFEKFGIRVLEGYGATETAPVISINTPMATKLGTVGKALPGLNYQIEPVEGIENGGKLVVSGDNVMLGYIYADNPDDIVVSAEFAGKRQYDTGDIVEVDSQGYISIQGRAKRFSKVAGEMVSHEVAEQIARAASKDHQHAILSRVDNKKGEALVLFTTNPNLTRNELVSSARENGWPELAIARDIRIVSEIPLLASGKVNYMQLKESLEG